ncbi:MAG: PsiF family protein [Usitatibacter sp.]
MPALAADGEHKASEQQNRMANCAHESKGMKADERHHFMSECLKGHGANSGAHVKEASAKPEAGHQQEKMRACNDEAGKKDLHGDERKAFMSACLKG